MSKYHTVPRCHEADLGGGAEDQPEKKRKLRDIMRGRKQVHDSE